MSERSKEAFIEALVQYPEMDDDERMDEIEDNAIYKSSSIDLQDTLGKPDFKFVYPILIQDIENQSFENKRVFCQKILKTVEEIYDFRFPQKLELETDGDIVDCLEFIKFLEFDNIIFLSFVWQYLNVKLLEINIEDYARKNSEKILKEVEEQLETHEQNQLISIFLRTYYKEKFIDWFVRETERSRTSILLEILEREGKLNV